MQKQWNAWLPLPGVHALCIGLCLAFPVLPTALIGLTILERTGETLMERR
jgi:hypothetical protein